MSPCLTKLQMHNRKPIKLKSSNILFKYYVLSYPFYDFFIHENRFIKTNEKIKFFVSVQYKVNCDNDYMTVDVKKTDDIKSIYLNQMKFYPGNI